VTAQVAEKASGGEYIAWLETLGPTDIGRVGGKNASLGEMIRHQAIDSISLNPDSFDATARHVAATEQRLEHLFGARERSR
jgi:phosphoenolpyruvate synthase/pyruvate phosphate dikinase